MIKPIIFGFYGYSNTGKTSSISRLIHELTSEGFSVAAIKQSGHSVTHDTPGKDTCIFSNEGANPSVLISDNGTSFYFKQKMEIEKVIQILTDLVLPAFIFIEGARDKEIKKIRFGNIKERDNTIWNYNQNYEDLKAIIKGEVTDVQFKN
jgi:molybdopterin-guanine dinucleotide biosynthesis protein B